MEIKNFVKRATPVICAFALVLNLSVVKVNADSVSVASVYDTGVAVISSALNGFEYAFDVVGDSFSYATSSYTAVTDSVREIVSSAIESSFIDASMGSVDDIISIVGSSASSAAAAGLGVEGFVVTGLAVAAVFGIMAYAKSQLPNYSGSYTVHVQDGLWNNFPSVDYLGFSASNSIRVQTRSYPNDIILDRILIDYSNAPAIGDIVYSNVYFTLAFNGLTTVNSSKRIYTVKYVLTPTSYGLNKVKYFNSSGNLVTISGSTNVTCPNGGSSADPYYSPSYVATSNTLFGTYVTQKFYGNNTSYDTNAVGKYAVFLMGSDYWSLANYWNPPSYDYSIGNSSKLSNPIIFIDDSSVEYVSGYSVDLSNISAFDYPTYIDDTTGDDIPYPIVVEIPSENMPSYVDDGNNSGFSSSDILTLISDTLDNYDSNTGEYNVDIDISVYVEPDSSPTPDYDLNWDVPPSVGPSYDSTPSDEPTSDSDLTETLPGDTFAGPWHYVLETFEYIAEFMVAFGMVINSLPYALRALLWASLVLLLLFGLLVKLLK